MLPNVSRWKFYFGIGLMPLLFLTGFAELKLPPSEAPAQQEKLPPVVQQVLHKVNDSFIKPYIGNGSIVEILNRWVPGPEGQFQKGVQGKDTVSAAIAAAPFLNSLTNAIPALKKLPGFNNGPSTGATGVPTNREFNDALEQVAGAIARATKRGEPFHADVDKFLKAIPNLVLNMPGFDPHLDLNKYDPKLLHKIITGQPIPGIPQELIDPILHFYTKKMAEAAQAGLNGHLLPQQAKYLPRLSNLAPETIAGFMSGGTLPGLNREQSEAIKEYYIRFPAEPPLSSEEQAGPPTNAWNSLLDILPKDYNMTQISGDVIKTVMDGRIPDLKSLPRDLQEHIKMNIDKVFSALSKSLGNSSLDDLMVKIPNFDRPELRTFDPYDLNTVNHEVRHKEVEEAKARRIRLYSGIVLGSIGLITIIVLTYLYFYSRNRIPNHTSYRPGPGSPPLSKKELLLTSTKIHAQKF